MSRLSIENYLSKLLRGLKTRNIDFVVSEDALGCNITEVYVPEAFELLVFPMGELDSGSIQWILQVRTPLKGRITLFSTEPSKLKIRVLSAINKLKQDGLEIPQPDHAISVKTLSEKNIQRLLDSLENWTNTKSNRKPLPLIHTSLPSTSKRKEKHSASNGQALNALRIHLRNAIKTYWTERYFARYMNIPAPKIKELAKRIGINSETCGNDTLYFFDRKKALATYFEHITKCVLYELKLKYQKITNHAFFLPDLHLTLHFFDGENEQLEILAGEDSKDHDLMVMTTERLPRNRGRLQDAFFHVLPLNQDKIKSALIKAVRQRIEYIPPYSSGIIK